MALIDNYKNYPFRKLKLTNNPEFPVPTATVKSVSPLSETVIKEMAKIHYENAPLLQTTYMGKSAEPLVSIKPNETKDQYGNKLNYTLTRAGAFTKWLFSPKGLRFSGNQLFLQSFNATLETKIWNPTSVFSNYIPFVDYHERRHMTLSSLFGIPLTFITGIIPSTYTEAIWATNRRSRNIYQSPLVAIAGEVGGNIFQTPQDISNQSLAGIDYATKARDIMAKKSTWEAINPNRYLYPIGSDGAGLPNSSRLTPKEELHRNIGLVKQGFRYTKSSGYNPILDAQITMNQQKIGSTFLQTLLKNVPFVNTIMSYFGYGILGASATKISIFNPYNPVFPYSTYSGKTIQIVDGNGEFLSEYDLKDAESPLERLLYTFKIATSVGNEASKDGSTTFANKASITGFKNIELAARVDSRLLSNPQDGSENLNQYLQTYGDISIKREKDSGGSLSPEGILDPADDKKTYTQYIKDTDARIVYSPKGYGFAQPGARSDDDRTADLINLLEYGEDLDDKDFTDLIPFKFYHENERKWIVFRASLTGINDQVTPEWNEKSYIGRADKLYVYKGATRKVSFSFSLMVQSPKELRPIYEKLNYLMGLSYPTYKNLSSSIGQYMEAPFVRLTIGDLFVNVPGIIDGGITITFDDEMTWEIRDEQPQTELDVTKIAKVPRLIRVTIGSFTPFSLNDKPISSTSPFYSAVKKWQNESV